MSAPRYARFEPGDRLVAKDPGRQRIRVHETRIESDGLTQNVRTKGGAWYVADYFELDKGRRR